MMMCRVEARDESRAFDDVTKDRNVSELVREAFDRYLENSPANSQGPGPPR